MTCMTTPLKDDEEDEAEEEEEGEEDPSIEDPDTFLFSSRL